MSEPGDFCLGLWNRDIHGHVLPNRLEVLALVREADSTRPSISWLVSFCQSG